MFKISNFIRKHLKIKDKDTGIYSETDYIKSLISLFACGGECIDDIERLRADEGLKKLGLSVPSSSSVTFFFINFMMNNY